MAFKDFVQRQTEGFKEAKLNFDVGCEVLGMPRDPRSVKERGQRMEAGKRERARRAAEAERAQGITIHGGNVQLATGDRSRQSMTVNESAAHIELLLQGIVEMLQASGASAGREPELIELRQSALNDLARSRSTNGLRRFSEWAVECAKTGATASTVAAVTAASNGLLHDAEALVQTIKP